MGTKGSCGNIRVVDIDIGYHKHGLLKVTDIKEQIISKSHLFL